MNMSLELDTPGRRDWTVASAKMDKGVADAGQNNNVNLCAKSSRESIKLTLSGKNSVV